MTEGEASSLMGVLSMIAGISFIRGVFWLCNNWPQLMSTSTKVTVASQHARTLLNSVEDEPSFVGTSEGIGSSYLQTRSDESISNSPVAIVLPLFLVVVGLSCLSLALLKLHYSQKPHVEQSPVTVSEFVCKLCDLECAVEAQLKRLECLSLDSRGDFHRCGS
jgi:hypothetical protein